MTAEIEPSTVKTKHRTRPANYLRTAGVVVPSPRDRRQRLAPLSRNGARLRSSRSAVPVSRALDTFQPDRDCTARRGSPMPRKHGSMVPLRRPWPT